MNRDPSSIREAHDRISAIKFRQEALAKKLAEDRMYASLIAAAKHLSSLRPKDSVARKPSRIINEVADRFSVTYDDITGPKMHRRFVPARHTAICEVAQANPRLSLLSLGKIFNRHHTTILHVLRQNGLRAQPKSKTTVS